MSAQQAASNEPRSDSMSEREKEVAQDDVDKKPQENPVEDDASMLSAGNLRVCVVQAIGGTLNGYSIGFVGVYSTLYGYSTNCANYRFESGCSTVPNANCKWFPPSGTAAGYCGWVDGTCSKLYPNEDNGGTSDNDAIVNCNGDSSRCAWSYSAGECQNPSGYSSSDNGIFAGAMIAGCLIGSVFAGPLATAIGAKISFLLVGIVGIVSSVMYHVSCAEDEFWVLIVGRFVIGLFLGVVGVACPMYTDQNAHPRWKRTIGCLFQVFTTFGIFMASMMGLALGQSIYFDHDRDQKTMARMQGLCAVSTMFSIVMIGLGVIVNDSRAKFDGGDDKNAIELDANEYGYVEMIPRLVMGTVMAGTLQLTGINAVMNYAPTIMGSLGLAPLVGNFYVMVWNFVTTIISIPLSYVFTMRQLFLFGSIFTSCMCMFMCGIPVYPGVSSRDAKDGVAITGIILFILGFEVCVGPCYYVLTQDMFPPSFRPRGASFTQVMQFIFNLIINVCYPIATERISGGKSGNQDKGQAIAFIFFGGLGIICFIVQVFFLHPWDEAKDGKKDMSPDQRRGEAELAQ
ncbi:glucose transporter lmgt3 [Leptomonas pyrrhocoris]|uniref:Glucose transporter lmgt3 n=1 Tax=Leptomonas pyrrhocoris TaxID=157538 RepID=A0A0M9G492_LEPPY|nr:glucose transporter lmgt3 [Leptomonas pyrrhocoris]XP_015660233.1 glucose transporter lmgt3 [Leptomonas pyrrhocoris]XP_015660234.1 glucose transporter lmgt3 [Leptomonas pyrrhocoris]XP_015660235.1 glucose transporter lmgt3 [Leptomonas pyrrhocoris]XP_015660236.1 glucose transporter lmgt3 [Leptomonas pyrrhocoris]XP_015660237.1 glucose transporter lmgt3 [Leptomonas pyrrhocoris]KPA81793.1 glucose transporter lmgt3 [Leptomonas pyrrhocoris]KPA81794.1 glucose transporter lmgt3 [Leptomonas pyrrhoco|eukprot:XP_015660232.1 glucose transporter lmgt3 [Leptomonas pyrrhocoris]